MVRNALVRWYKRQAQQKLQDKVDRFAPIVGVALNGVRIKTLNPAGEAALPKAAWNSIGRS